MHADVVSLGAGDEPELEQFLARHADSSMFLRSNLRRAGIVDRGERFEGTYVAVRDSDGLVAVAAHWWNGVLSVQGDVDAVGAVARAAVAQSNRVIAGFAAPWAHLVAARAA